MNKSLIGLAAATAVGLATLAGPSTANAGCYWSRQRVWVEGYGYRWRSVPVCP